MASHAHACLPCQAFVVIGQAFVYLLPATHMSPNSYSQLSNSQNVCPLVTNRRNAAHLALPASSSAFGPTRPGLPSRPGHYPSQRFFRHLVTTSENVGSLVTRAFPPTE
jgi:hypothetical protein